MCLIVPKATILRHNACWDTKKVGFVLFSVIYYFCRPRTGAKGRTRSEARTLRPSLPHYVYSCSNAPVYFLKRLNAGDTLRDYERNARPTESPTLHKSWRYKKKTNSAVRFNKSVVSENEHKHEKLIFECTCHTFQSCFTLDDLASASVGYSYRSSIRSTLRCIQRVQRLVHIFYGWVKPLKC